MLFSALFLPDSIREAVSERAWVQSMLDAEAALVWAESRAGIVPASAAEEIARACQADRFDLETVAIEARNVGNPAEPLARMLRRAVSPEAARYVHHGATSQD